MNLTHILIDLENVKPTAADMSLICEPRYRLWLFRGPHQNTFDAEIVEELQPLGDRVKHIRSAKSGKNALDFLIAFHIGRLIGVGDRSDVLPEKDDVFVIVSKDGGFEALIGHVQLLGYGAARVVSVREVLSLDQTNGITLVPEPVAETALPKKEPATKSVTTRKKTPTPKVQPPKPKVKTTAASPTNTARPDAWSRTLENLRDHPNNRPTTSKTLERHLATLLGKETSQEVVKEQIARLQREGIAMENGKKIEYKIPEKKK